MQLANCPANPLFAPSEHPAAGLIGHEHPHAAFTLSLISCGFDVICAHAFPSLMDAHVMLVCVFMVASSSLHGFGAVSALVFDVFVSHTSHVSAQFFCRMAPIPLLLQYALTCVHLGGGPRNPLFALSGHCPPGFIGFSGHEHPHAPFALILINNGFRVICLHALCFLMKAQVILVYCFLGSGRTLL